MRYGDNTTNRKGIIQRESDFLSCEIYIYSQEMYYILSLARLAPGHLRATF